jgi:hypothetical protein
MIFPTLDLSKEEKAARHERFTSVQVYLQQNYKSFFPFFSLLGFPLGFPVAALPSIPLAPSQTPGASLLLL